MSSGIYAIRNLANDRVYVGHARNIPRRWKAHRHMLAKGRHHSPGLQAAWVKYGEDLFLFEILEVVDDPAKLVEREQYWIDTLRAAVRRYGYNVGPVAGSRAGVPMSKSARAKISAFQKGRPKTPEHAARISAANKGRELSPEHRRKVVEIALRNTTDPDALNKNRAAALERWADPETRAKYEAANRRNADARRGKPRDPEIAAKVAAATRAAWTGRTHTDETKAKLSKARKGMKLPEEWRRKIGQAQLGRKRSEETKAKLRQKALEREARRRAQRESGELPKAPRDPAWSAKIAEGQRAAWARRKALAAE